MVAPSSLDARGDDDGGGGRGVADVRWCGDALESTASRTLTTHSSPCDVSDDEHQQHAQQAQPAPFLPLSSKVVDEPSAAEYYRSVETPRSVVTNEGAGSIRSIQIQVESRDRTPSHAESSRPRSLFGHRRTAPRVTGHHKRPRALHERCRALLLEALTVVGPPALVLTLLHFSVPYTMLCVLNVVTALAAWEWSWWSFRIRRRLLLPFHHAQTNEPTADTTMPPHTAMTPRERPATSVEDLQDAVLNEPVLAIQKVTKGFSRRGKYFVAAAISVLVAAAVVAVVMACADSIVTKSKSDVGKNLLLASCIVGSLSAVFCACLTPVPADAFVVCVYETCFIVSSLNSFLSHHEHLVHDPELLDSMYVLLVGACAIVVWRIVSSKEVMESTIMAMLDILGLAYLVAPMMAMADFLGHPTVGEYDDVVGTFFVVVSAAEAAYRLNEMLKRTYPRFLQSCRRPVTKNVSNALGYESLALSTVFGIVGSVLSVLCFHGYIIYWQDALVYLGAIFMSQFCRLALDSVKVMAKVDTIRYQPWLSGYMDLVNPYLLAMIVFHPYVKALIKTQG